MSPPSHDAAIRRMGEIIAALDTLHAEFDAVQRSLGTHGVAPRRGGDAISGRSSLASRVLELISSSDKTWTAAELVEPMQSGRPKLNVALSSLHNEGHLRRVKRGVYTLDRGAPSKTTPTPEPRRMRAPTPRREKTSGVAPKTVHRRRAPNAPKRLEARPEQAYITNGSTNVIPWAAQLEAFARLPGLRHACWDIILESGRFTPLVLERLAKVAEVELPQRWSTNVSRLRDRSAVRRSLAQWCLEVDPFGDVLHSVIWDLEALAAGDPGDWPPRMSSLQSQNRCWFERCRAALRTLDELRGRIAASNLGLCMKAARPRMGQGGLSFGDLTHEAFFGVLRAVDRFEPARGLKFSTYAVWWIRQSTNRAIQNNGRTVRIPVHLQQFYLEVRAARGHVGNDAVCIAAHLNVPLWKVEKLLKYENTVFSTDTLDRPVSKQNGGDATLGDMIPSDDPSPLDSLEVVEFSREMRRIIECLPRIDAEVIRRRFGIDCPAQTLSEIGHNNSLSRERIRQIETRAVGLLRKIVATPRADRQDAFHSPVDEHLCMKVMDVLEAQPRHLLSCSKIGHMTQLDTTTARLVASELEGRNLLHRVGRRFMWLPSEDCVDEHECDTTLNQTEKKVLSFLQEHPEQNFARTVIGRELEMDAWAVRVSLGRLCRRNIIQQVGARFSALSDGDAAMTAG